MKKYWDNAITFEEYMEVARQRAENPGENDGYKEYYELGLQRMERTLKTFKISPETQEAFKSKKFTGKILIITEPWCGDASATVPAVSKFFEAAGNEVRIFLRDSDLTLIDQFLTNGTQSIPKVLILNNDLTLKSDWGPRPKYGMDLLKKFKENEETYPREEFYNDLQVYYAKNRGADAIEEIINLI
ncbi:thioredoxin family protein [Kaistella sp. DKR-2]|uniref:thioredoxin family protein n=1 Tax=Kaistella soli TaxID=2849654 RepID=UPI001C257897|nr:thioredoxin family protein [Kaistella soli]MBU8882701.1 thioredoxin family protein [Kaistella soli]